MSNKFFQGVLNELVAFAMTEELTEGELKILHRLIHRAEMLKESETNED